MYMCVLDSRNGQAAAAFLGLTNQRRRECQDVTLFFESDDLMILVENE
jgi:hypothetical protein